MPQSMRKMDVGLAFGESTNAVRAITPFVWQGLPTKVVMAPGAAFQIIDELEKISAARVMLVAGRSAGNSSLARELAEKLGARLRARFDSVPPHSSVATVREGAARARAENIDAFLAIGGGSASDTAKAIAILLAEGGDLPDHANVFYPPDRYDQKILKRPKLPIFVIPTTASAAEVTPGLGIRGDDGHKLVFWDPNVVPRVILLDPEVNRDVPADIVASTAMNAMAHCVEGLYSRVKNPISEGIALQAAGMLRRGIPAMIVDPAALEPRTEVMVGAHLSGHVIANARVGLHHAICHGLGSHGGLPHGIANAIMLPHVMRYNLSAATAELATLARALGEDIAGLSPSAAADRAISAIEALQAEARVPRRLRDAGFDRTLIPAIAEMTLSDRGAYFNPIPAAPKADIASLMEKAW